MSELAELAGANWPAPNRCPNWPAPNNSRLSGEAQMIPSSALDIARDMKDLSDRAYYFLNLMYHAGRV